MDKADSISKSVQRTRDSINAIHKSLCEEAQKQSVVGNNLLAQETLRLANDIGKAYDQFKMRMQLD